MHGEGSKLPMAWPRKYYLYRGKKRVLDLHFRDFFVLRGSPCSHHANEQAESRKVGAIGYLILESTKYTLDRLADNVKA